jgi:hypothetical protein
MNTQPALLLPRCCGRLSHDVPTQLATQMGSETVFQNKQICSIDENKVTFRNAGSIAEIFIVEQRIHVYGNYKSPPALMFRAFI